MQVIVEQDEIGFLFRNGKYQKFLEPGKHSFWALDQIVVEKARISEQIRFSKPLEILLADSKLAGKLSVIEVQDHELGLHFTDKNLKTVLKPGKYAFFNGAVKHRVQLVDVSTPIVAPEIHASVFSHPEMAQYHWGINPASYQRAIVFFNGKVHAVLEPGRYYYWRGLTSVTMQEFDMRQQQLDMTGQEIMTHDKVTLRLNFVCQYRIVDPLKVYLNIKEHEKQLYIQLQLILREYVGQLKLDELLEKKEEVGQFILERLKKSAGDWGIEFSGAGIKDVILPGEIKDILNKVIEAEKRAQANVITRREETASTRSLLNTVKLMEDNPLLVKLKEWEYIEAIAAKVSNISVSSGADLLNQLGNILAPKK